MRRNSALAERLAGGTSILWQHLALRHLRGVVDARQVALTLLHLALAILTDLTLNLVGPAVRVIRIVGLVDQVAATSSLAAALIALVGIDARLSALALTKAVAVRAATA